MRLVNFSFDVVNRIVIFELYFRFYVAEEVSETENLPNIFIDNGFEIKQLSEQIRETREYLIKLWDYDIRKFVYWVEAADLQFVNHLNHAIRELLDFCKHILFTLVDDATELFEFCHRVIKQSLQISIGELVVFESGDNVVHILADVGKHCAVESQYNISEVCVDIIQILLIH